MSEIVGSKTVKLNFLAPVHFGDGRLSDSNFSCDAATLYSALHIEALRLGHTTAEELLHAAKIGELSISDGFPFIDNVFYLPKPMLPPGGTTAVAEGAQSHSNQSVDKKAFKKLRFISADRYCCYLDGSISPQTELKCFNLGESAVQTKVNLSYEHKDDADPYRVGSFSFHANAGLYFMVRGSFDIQPLLEQLQYSGLGGKRSSGYGRFSYQITADNPVAQSNCKEYRQSGSTEPEHPSFILLATAAPTPAELTEGLLLGARYSLRRKGGFVQSASHHANSQKKRDFYTFSAGSVFAQQFSGDVFDVNATPNAHPVYRYARAMWMEV